MDNQERLEKAKIVLSNIAFMDKENKETIDFVLAYLQTLIDIEKGGFPKEEKSQRNEGEFDWGYVAGYNQALSDCKLYLASRYDEEKIKEIINKHIDYVHLDNLNIGHPVLTSIDKLAHALHNWLIGEIE